MSVIKKVVKIIAKSQPVKEISDCDLEYFLWICSLYHQIGGIPGHIAEVGVASGRNAVLFGKLIKIFGDTSVRQYIGFDTFDGYLSEDIIRDSYLKKGNDRWKAFTRKGVLERCEANDVDDSVELFEGDASVTIPQVLTNHNGKKFQANKGRFALVYIDCNAFRPAINAMSDFLPYMMPGGIFAIDEKLQGGETEAIINFAGKNNLIIQKPGIMQVPMLVRLRAD